MLCRKQQFTSGWNVFLREEKVHWRTEIRKPETSRTEENITKVCQILLENRRLTVKSIVEQVDILVDRETVRKILTEDLQMCKNGPKVVHRRTKAKKSHNLPRRFGEARWHFWPCHHTWKNMGLQIRPWNEAVKCTMEDCQFPTTKVFRQSKSRVKKILLSFFDIRGIIHYEFVPTERTVNQINYLEAMEWLREKVRRKRP